MRVALAAILPNITLPIWARLFQRAVLPTVDRCLFLVGTRDAEMRQVAREALAFAGDGLEIRDRAQNHGGAFNELYSRLAADPETKDASILVLEDDCYVTCAPSCIESIWCRLPGHHVMGSRMSTMASEVQEPRFLDTYGEGLYPNMMFAELATLREHTDLDFRSRDRGDVGHWVGVALHQAGIHTELEAHLPQCRLSAYSGTMQVDPSSWSGPWLHVGEMSGPTGWTSDQRPGRFEAMAAYAAALESGETPDCEQARRLAHHVEVTEQRWPTWQPYYQDCKRLMGRVFRVGRDEGQGRLTEGLREALRLQGEVLDRLQGDVHRFTELHDDSERRLKIMEDRCQGRS